MTSDGLEVLGTDERRPPNVALRGVLVLALIAGGIVTAATRSSTRHPDRAPTTEPSPGITIAPETTFAGPYGPRVGRVGDVAVVMSHTTSAPVYGTVTTLDGPPGESPLTFSTATGLAFAAAGLGHDGWFAERVLPTGPVAGVLDERDIRTGSILRSLSLAEAPQSVAVTPHSVWVGLPGALAAVDPQTGAVRMHAVGSGDVVDLAADPTHDVLFGAIAGPRGSRVVRWRLPDLTIVGQRAIATGFQATHLALAPGGLWVSAVSDSGASGRIYRLDAATFATEVTGATSRTAPPETVFAGTHEVWLLAADGALRCARANADRIRLGPIERVPDFTRRDDLTGELVAVGDRVYVVTGQGTIAYERSVVCP